MAKGGQGPKLVIAVVFFVIAAGVIAWQMGVFGGGGGAAVSEERQEMRDEAERFQQKVDRGEAEASPTVEGAP